MVSSGSGRIEVLKFPDQPRLFEDKLRVLVDPLWIPTRLHPIEQILLRLCTLGGLLLFRRPNHRNVPWFAHWPTTPQRGPVALSSTTAGAMIRSESESPTPRHLGSVRGRHGWGEASNASIAEWRFAPPGCVPRPMVGKLMGRRKRLHCVIVIRPEP